MVIIRNCFMIKHKLTFTKNIVKFEAEGPYLTEIKDMLYYSSINHYNIYVRADKSLCLTGLQS